MKKLLFLFLFLFITQSLIAAPDRVSRKLIDEKVSLMDFGCYPVTISLEDLSKFLEDDNFQVGGYCRYDTERDEIILEIHVYPKYKENSLDYEPKDWALFKDKVDEIEKNITFRSPMLASSFLHFAQYVEKGGVDEKDTKYILKKFKNMYFIDAFTKIAEQQDGKLVFFDVEHKGIKKE